MQIVVWIIMVVLVLIALYFYYQFEKNNEEILNLEAKLERLMKEQETLLNVKKVAVKEVKKEIYELVFQSQHYDSVENLKNKMKTVLIDLDN